MTAQKGLLYHIKDAYFDKVQDEKLMQNKEGGAFRPTFYCYKDPDSSIMWMIPLSCRVEKYRTIRDKQVKKYGRCFTIVIGIYSGREAAFLLQNMFPITERYIDHVHMSRGRIVPVSANLQKKIENNLRRILRLRKKGIKTVYPDIDRLEQMMREELEIGAND